MAVKRLLSIDSGGIRGIIAAEVIVQMEDATSTGSIIATPTPNYPSAFAQALKEIGQISPLDFAQRYPHNAQYLPQLTWNPTTAQFWDQFNIDPDEHNSNPNQTTLRLNDFRLNDAERAIFQKNGFVVSERLGAESFATLFYRIYSNDLPVFVSTVALQSYLYPTGIDFKWLIREGSDDANCSDSGDYRGTANVAPPGAGKSATRG